MSNLPNKLIRSSALRVLNLLGNIAVSFYLMPFVIGSLGDKWYGLWVLVGTLVGYYGFLDVGLTSAIQRFVSSAIGKRDFDDLNETFNTCHSLFLFASLISILVTLVIVGICPLFIENTQDIQTFRRVIFIVGLSFAISFPVRSYIGVFNAHVRYDVTTAIELAKLLFRTTLIFTLLGRGYGIITLALINLTMEILFGTVTLILTFKFYPELILRRSFFSRSKIRMLFDYSIYSFIAKIADSLRFNIDSFVIAGFLGLTFVTHYNIAARITYFYRMLIASAIGIMLPVFSQYEAQKDYEQIRLKYLFVSKLGIILSILIGSSIIIYGKAFISRWMGTDYLDSYTALTILIIGTTFERFHSISVSLIYGLSKHKFYSFLSIFDGLLNLGLSLILVRKYGILGVALGTTIPMLLMNLFILPVYIRRIIKIDLAEYAKTFVGTIVVCSVVIFANWMIVKGLIIPEYLRMFPLAILTSVIYLTVTIFVLLSREERSYFRIPF